MDSLYKIDAELKEVLEQAELEAINSDGEISDITFNMLEKLNQDRPVKISNICKYYKSLLAEAKMVSDEAKNLNERASATKKKAENLKKYLAESLKNDETFTDETTKISWRKSQSINIDIDKEFKSNSEYVNTKVTESWDKKALKEAIKKGVKIDGVALIENKNIQIK